jgi:hypothetical protein
VVEVGALKDSKSLNVIFDPEALVESLGSVIKPAV